MVLVDFGEFKIRFDPKEVRISIDGEIIDVGVVRRTDTTDGEVLQKLEDHKFYSIDGNSISGEHLKELISGQKSP